MAVTGLEAKNAARLPQRRRGRERVAKLVASASALFAEKGFEATTMTEIASRAGAPIGSLYQFFPTKQAIAHAVMETRSLALSDRLDVLLRDISGQSAAAIGQELFDALLGFVSAHPEYVALVDLPGNESWKRDGRIRRRAQIAGIFETARPPLAEGQPKRLAAVIAPLIRTALAAGEEALPRDAVLAELRAMLRHHLEACAPA